MHVWASEQELLLLKELSKPAKPDSTLSLVEPFLEIY